MELTALQRMHARKQGMTSTEVRATRGGGQGLLATPLGKSFGKYIPEVTSSRTRGTGGSDAGKEQEAGESLGGRGLAPAGSPRRAGTGTSRRRSASGLLQSAAPVCVHRNWTAASSYSFAIFQLNGFNRGKSFHI